jgi:ABC-type antimicrobial peptide transport system permease subunit
VLARAVSSLLYQVGPGDPMTFGAMALVLIASAFAGCYIPARRATTVSPLVALKVD